MNAKKKKLNWKLNPLEISSIISVLIIISIAITKLARTGAIISSDKSYEHLGAVANLIPLNQSAWIGMGIITYLLALFSLHRLNSKETAVKYFGIIYALSPVTIYSTINPTFNSLFASLLIIIIACIYFNKTKLLTISFGVLILFGSKLILFAALGILVVYLNQRKAYLKKILFGMLIVAIIKGIYLKDLWVFERSGAVSILAGFVQEFGTHYGVSILIILFGVLGAITFWSKKSHQEIIFGLMAVISIYTNNVILFNLILLIFAARIIRQFSETKWKVKAFEAGVIILTILLFVNSTMILITGINNEGPSEIELVGYSNFKSLEGTGLFDSTRGNVLLHYTNLEPYALIDGSTKSKISNQIFYSTKFDLTKELIVEQDIDYIVINEKMVENIWNGNERGLLIMVSDQSTFELVYSDEYVRVFEVLAGPEDE